MKILQVGSSLRQWGGIERYITYLTEGLMDKGHEVWVTCPENSPLSKKTRGHIVNIDIHRKLEPHGFRGYFKLFQAHQFDVIHLHYSPDFWAAGIAARAASKGTTILTRHVAEPWAAPKRAYYLSLFDHIVPVSDAVRRVLLASGVPKDRMSFAKAGCPSLEPTTPRDEMRRNLGFHGFTFGIFGRLVREKGLDVAIKASAKSKFPLEIFGDGPQRENLERLAKELNAPARFWGFREDVADAMNAVDSVLIPSRWAEAFPFAALEAMSIAKPIIASARGGLPEMVRDGFTGWLFTSEDHDALAERMANLACDPELALQFGQRAKNRHHMGLTVPAMADRMERLYCHLVEQRKVKN